MVKWSFITGGIGTEFRETAKVVFMDISNIHQQCDKPLHRSYIQHMQLH